MEVTHLSVYGVSSYSPDQFCAQRLSELVTDTCGRNIGPLHAAVLYSSEDEFWLISSVGIGGAWIPL